MIKTNKVIGFYTDAFGNEIDEYEEIERYEVCYNGHFFDGDRDGWNGYKCDEWETAKGVYDFFVAKGVECHINDNEYDVVFCDGEWK